MARFQKPAVLIMGAFLFVLAFPFRAPGQWPRPFHDRAPESRPPAPRFLQEVEWSVFWLTNEQRQRWGLPVLAWDKRLAAAARSHTADMLHRRFFSHLTPEGYSLKDRLAAAYPHAALPAGENIWSGAGLDYGDSRALARVIVEGWMASSGHQANILNAAYTHLGVGVAVLGAEIRATQDFLLWESR